MNVIIETETEEQKAVRKEIRETKKQLKELAQKQKEDKTLLRMPHYDIPTIEITTRSGYKFECGGKNRAGHLMNDIMDRANQITRLHIKYNQLRGKPYDMHEYKK